MNEMKLPSGATVQLRDIASLKHGDRKKIYTAIGIDGKPSLAEGAALVDMLISIIVESWTLDMLPPGVRIESLEELSIEDYDALQAQAEKVLPALFPQLANTVEAELNPKVITADSSA